MPQQQGQSAVKTGLHIDEPAQYDVIMLNDDFTTMEFVVEVLTQIFFHTAAEAEAIMLKIHHAGSAVVATLSYDMATTKASQARTAAREQGFPLRLKVEPHK